jgi:uncharacterized membrane protein YidH (DUF202 family)
MLFDVRACPIMWCREMDTSIKLNRVVDFRDYLAEERTCLAWIRTGIAFSTEDVFLAGIAAIRWPLADLASPGAISRTPDSWE